MDEKELLKNLNARCFELHEKQHAFVSPNANSDFLPLIAKINIKNLRLARFERATYPLKGECSTC